MGSSFSWLLWREPELKPESSATVKTTVGTVIYPLHPNVRYHTRTLPYNVENAAAALVTDMQRAELTLEGDANDRLIALRWPPKGRNRKQQATSCWPLVQDMDDVRLAIAALMAEDGLERIDSAQELCARYPGYFWNVVFYHAKDAVAVFQFIQDEFGGYHHHK